MLSEREAKIRDAVRCPKCAAEPGEPCFSSEGYYHVGTHWPERFDLYQATLRGELYASIRCQICGVDTPHVHWNDEIGTVDVRMPATILRRLMMNGEVPPTGLLLARLLHFLRRAKPTDAGTGADTSGEAGPCAGCIALLDRAAEMLADVQEEPDGWQEWVADREKHMHAQVTGTGADTSGEAVTSTGSRLVLDVWGLCVESDRRDTFADRVKVRRQVAQLIDDAIKAAVAEALRLDRERSAAWVKFKSTNEGLSFGDLMRRILRGSDAPGAGKVCSHGCTTDDCVTFCRPIAGGCDHRVLGKVRP